MTEPYTLEGRALPNPNGPGSPPDEDADYAPCIFCGERICHINDGGEGWLLGAVVEGQTRYYLYHNDPCIDGRTRDLAIWRCGCERDYVENVGPTCHCCGRKREECIPGDQLGPCKGCHKEWSARVHLDENTCPNCGLDWREGGPMREKARTVTVAFKLGFVTDLGLDEGEPLPTGDALRRILAEHALDLLKVVEYDVDEVVNMVDEHEVIDTVTDEETAAAMKAGVTVNELRESQSCKKCGSPLKNGRCTDETCPYSDRGQDQSYTEG